MVEKEERETSLEGVGATKRGKETKRGNLERLG
jgi:hypothetical protein